MLTDVKMIFTASRKNDCLVKYNRENDCSGAAVIMQHCNYSLYSIPFSLSVKVTICGMRIMALVRD